MKKSLIFSLLTLLALTSNIGFAQNGTRAVPSSVIETKVFAKHNFKLIDSTYAIEKVKINNNESVKIIHTGGNDHYVLIFQVKFKHIKGANPKEVIEKGLEVLEILNKGNLSVFNLKEEIDDYRKYINLPDFDVEELYKHFFYNKDSDYFLKSIDKIVVDRKYDEVFLNCG